MPLPSAIPWGIILYLAKKPIPKFPNVIGVVTSPTGAAVRDIFSILSRRYPSADIIMCPVLVQGENAAFQLSDAINRLSKEKIVDVIIIGRGGGSQEDLWAFNDENLARAIFNCDIPVISAVGHETDFTICDFVSDLRAPTPSAAAELAVPDKAELLMNLDAQKQYITTIIDKKIRDYENSLNNSKRLINAYSPEILIDNYNNKLDNLSKRMVSLSKNLIDNRLKALSETASKLSSLNPVNVLMRGYSYVTDSENMTVSSVNDVKNGDDIRITLNDGSLNAKVIK